MESEKHVVTSQPGYGPGPNQPPSYYPANQGGYPGPQQGYPGVVPPGTTVIVQQETMPSMAGWIGLSCFVFWCCNCLFGAIAFFIALSGTSARSRPEAEQLGRTSMWLSIAGIIVSVALAAIMIGLVLGGVIHYGTNINPYYSG